MVMRDGSLLCEEFRQGYGILLRYHSRHAVEDPVANGTNDIPAYNNIRNLVTKRILDDQPTACEDVVNNNVVDV